MDATVDLLRQLGVLLLEGVGSRLDINDMICNLKILSFFFDVSLGLQHRCDPSVDSSQLDVAVHRRCSFIADNLDAQILLLVELFEISFSVAAHHDANLFTLAAGAAIAWWMGKLEN